jgi:hypothetical protein
MEIIFALIIAALPACQSEDSSNCYYDASANGNGVGSSFVDINGTAYRSAEELFGMTDVLSEPVEIFNV